MGNLVKERVKLAILISIIAIAFIILPFFWRQEDANDIERHSKFAIGKIVRLSSTLKSGDYWHYEFRYKNNIYTNSSPTHIDYRVSVGDYFLINFSSQNPENSKIFYEYKLDKNEENYKDSVWDTIPKSLLRSSIKE